MTAVETVNSPIVTYVNIELLQKIVENKQKVGVREYTGKRIDPTKPTTLICVGGKRVLKQEAKLKNLSTLINPYKAKRAMKHRDYYLNALLSNIKINRPKRVLKADYKSTLNNSLIATISLLDKLGSNALNYLSTKAHNIITNFKNNELVLLRSEAIYLNKKLKSIINILKINLERLALIFKKNYLVLKNNVIAKYQGKRAKKSKSLGISLSCIGLAFILTVTSLASFKKETKESSMPAEPSKTIGLVLDDDTSILQESTLKSISYESKLTHFSSLASQEEQDKQEVIETLDLDDGVDTVGTVSEEPEVLAPASAEPETPTASSYTTIAINSNIELSDNSANSNLVYFNPNDFYRCPEDVTTEELLDILGISYNLFYNEIYGIFCSESGASYNGYNEVYPCFYTVLNRICTPNWVGSHGTSIYKQAVAPNQYVVYQNGTYTSYKNYSEYDREVALTAMRDAMYNFIVDPTHRPHSWTSFRSNSTTDYSNNLFTPKGNRYGSTMQDVVYPEFLESDAAVALRNRALGIEPETGAVNDNLVVIPYTDDNGVDQATVYNYTDNTLYFDSVPSSDGELVLQRTMN